MLESQIEI